MISRAEIIDRADCAYASGDIELGNLWIALLASLDLESARSTHSRVNPDQEELQKDKNDEQNGDWTR